MKITRFESEKIQHPDDLNRAFQDILSPKNYYSFAAQSRKRVRSPAKWQKCQVNRCPYRKSRFVTSCTTSANESNTGSKFFSACWPIVSFNPKISKSNHPTRNFTSCTYEAAAAVVMDTNKKEPPSPKNFSNAERSKKLSKARPSGETLRKQESSKHYPSRSRNSRRRDKYFAHRVRRKWKQCPSAPHNTTSFIMEYHKDELPVRSDDELDIIDYRESTSSADDSWSESEVCCEEKSSDDWETSETLLQFRRGNRSRSWEDYLLQDELPPSVQR